MKPRKLKELLVFAIVHKAPELLPDNKKDQLEEALMKLNTDELEILEDFMGGAIDLAKPNTKKRKKDTEDSNSVEEDVDVEDDEEVTA